MMIENSEIQSHFSNLSTFRWERLPSIIDARHYYPLPGKSGQVYYFQLDRNLVEINDKTPGSPYILKASLEDRILTWNLWTKDISDRKNPQYHPDMPRSTASKFYDLAFDYLSKHNPGGIYAILGLWIDGENLSEYHSNLKEGMVPKVAATQTWSGRKAVQYGFTNAILYNQSPNLMFMFTK